MSLPRRDNDRTEPHYTAKNPHEHNTTRPEQPHARRTRATPHPDVVAAAEFLLTQPDTHLYRRHYLELITHTPNPDGTTTPDYTAAENYLLTTAARCRKALRSTSPLSTTRTPCPHRTRQRRPERRRQRSTVKP
ncbi:hypothetical protein ACMTN4_00790 (plasmid) [Rhodococcus globerulus]|uniref:hypothetical protein n=1 Tax=Rhodococcus globerulus TaxID=33008 RepID=UPI0039E7AE4C